MEDKGTRISSQQQHKLIFRSAGRALWQTRGMAVPRTLGTSLGEWVCIILGLRGFERVSWRRGFKGVGALLEGKYHAVLSNR